MHGESSLSCAEVSALSYGLSWRCFSNLRVARVVWVEAVLRHWYFTGTLRYWLRKSLVSAVCDQCSLVRSSTEESRGSLHHQASLPRSTSLARVTNYTN